MKRRPLSALRRMLLSATALVLGASMAQAEDAVLVSRSVADYVPGAIISDAQKLELPDGANAVFLFRSGEMLELKGPFEGSLVVAHAKGHASGVEALVQALRGEGIDASAVGATRSLGPLVHSAMDGKRVTIDPHRSAIYCIGSADPLSARRLLPSLFSEKWGRCRGGQQGRPATGFVVRRLSQESVPCAASNAAKLAKQSAKRVVKAWLEAAQCDTSRAG